jgi:hypothetical protein
MRLTRPVLWLLASLAAVAPAAFAQDAAGSLPEDPPGYPPAGLPSQADAYLRALTAKRPPQPAPKAIDEALKAAGTATQAGTHDQAVAGFERAIGQGDGRAETWLALGSAWLARTPPDPQRALQALWLGYQAATTDAERQRALRASADVFEQRIARPREALGTLERLRMEAGTQPDLEARIAALRQRVGLELRQIRVDTESDRPRICLYFSAELAPKRGLVLEEYVRIEPTAAVSADADGNALCLSGVSHGARYTVSLREGLPGTGGLILKASQRHEVRVGDRQPSVGFRSGPFLLPRGGPDGVPVTTVNLDGVALRLYRINDRNLAPTLAADELLGPVYRSSAEDLADSQGELLWSGRMEVRRERNRAVVTPIPFRTLLGSAPRPGLYVLTAEPADLPESELPEPQATQWLLLSDIGLTAMRGADGVHVFARSLATARPTAGLTLTLVARNNTELARATTDVLGRARFEAGAARGKGGNEPVLVMAYGADGDYAVLDLTRAAFDLTDRGVGGRPVPGPLDAYVYTERGVYRPGETVRATVLLRDDRADAVPDFPLTLKVLRPNGTVYRTEVGREGAPGAFTLPIALTATAPLGTWQVEAYGDPKARPVGRVAFQVEEFVPERLEVTAEPSAPFITPGTPFALTVASRFLYGPPAAGLSGRVELSVRPDPAPYPMHPGFRFGLAQETVTARTEGLQLPPGDPEGLSRLPIQLPTLPDTTRPLLAELRVEVAEPGGRPTRQSAQVPVRHQPFAIGVRPRFSDDRVQEGGTAEVEAVVVEPDGRAVARTGLEVELFAEHVDYLWYVRDGAYQYRVSTRAERLQKRALDVAAEGPAVAGFGPLAAGRYRVEVSDPASGVATSVRFSAGWQAAGTPGDRPDRVEVTADRPGYRPGDTARLRVVSPFAGEAQITVASDRVLEVQTLTVPEGGATVELPVTTAWGTGAYVIASVYRPPVADRSHVPVRAIGLAWAPIEAAPRTLRVALEAPEKVRGRQTLEVPIAVTGADGSPASEAWVTLAAVDEGILQLTDFASPDPAAFYLGKRRLGLDIRDDYGRLIDALSGPGGALRQGGDQGGLGVSLPQVPLTVVSLFRGPVRTDGQGRVRVPLELPDFNGQVRLMAVAFDRARVGAAAAPLTVRDPVVAELTLPRFLAPGDESQATVSVHNVEGEPGAYRVRVLAEGALATPAAEFAADLAQGARQSLVAPLAAGAAGSGTVRVALEGPGGLALERSLALTVRPSRPVETAYTVDRLAAGASTRFDAARLTGQVPGTGRLRLTYSSRPPFDVAGLLAALDRYPYGCLEQVVSRGLPLLSAARLGAGPEGPPPREGTLPGRVLDAIGQVLDKQGYAGSFGVWSSHGQDPPWLTAYAMEFLTRARSAGQPVADAPFQEGLEWLRRHAIDGGTEAEDLVSRAYAVHVLALAGVATPGAARYLHETFLDRIPTPLARAQLAAALARLGDEDRARAAAARATEGLKREYWSTDYGSTVRDAAALVTVLGEVKLLDDATLQRLVEHLPAGALGVRETSTQEQAWLVLAAETLMAGTAPPRLSVRGTGGGKGDPLVLAPTAQELTAGVQVTNTGPGELWQAVTVTGVPETPQPAVREGMQVRRHFLTRTGEALNLDAVHQNDVFYVLLAGTATSGIAHQALLTHGLPAGWEIETARLDEDAARAMPWLGALDEPVAVEGRDDRYVAAFDLTPEQPSFQVAYRVRAVTPGSYELPGAQLEDMYRPRFIARQAAGRIRVLPPR